MDVVHEAFDIAREHSHTDVTVEHLFLALLDDPYTLETLKLCGANIRLLRKELTDFVVSITPEIKAAYGNTIQPTSELQRVLREAIDKASRANKSVDGKYILIPLLDEIDSQVYQYLQQQNISKSDVIANTDNIGNGDV